MAGVQLSGVSKRFGAVEVLKSIDLNIIDGEFVVFVGPSGCGKSTLLRTIAGLEEATGGEIRIGDRVVNEVSPSDRGIAMVFQSYALYPHMSVYENMAFALKLAKATKVEIDQRVRAAAEVLNISDYLNRKPKALSGGQRQRVAIGRAIVRQPEVFLFDEPLSNLDAALRVKMRYEFARLHQELGSTMIYVTHDQVEAMTLADRIVVLSAGRIEQVGAPMELYETPANLFVAEFIGSPRMNLIQATVEAADPLGVTVRAVGGARLRAAVNGAGLAVGETVTLGVRPESLSVGGLGDPLETRVTFVESLGNATYAYLEQVGGDEALTLQLPGDQRPRAGDALTVRVPPSACHLFVADGRALPRIRAKAAA